VTTTDIALVVSAGVAVLCSIGSVLLLAYRIGRLTGSTEARIAHGENDRVRIWQAIGQVVAKVDRHIETPHGRPAR